MSLHEVVVREHGMVCRQFMASDMHVHHVAHARRHVSMLPVHVLLNMSCSIMPEMCRTCTEWRVLLN